MVDDIIFTLASVRGLLVISRTSALAFRTGPIDLEKIGRDLGVRYVLSGSLRRSGNCLRITAELSNVETGSLIWADRYDGDLADLFDLQERIATRIVWSVAPNIREAELRSARRKRPENMNAYDLLMQAIDLLYHMNPSDFSRAGELLRQAIAADDSMRLHTLMQRSGKSTTLTRVGLPISRQIQRKLRGWRQHPSIATPPMALRSRFTVTPRRYCFAITPAQWNYFIEPSRRPRATPWHGRSVVASTHTLDKPSQRSNGPKWGCDCLQWIRSLSFTSYSLHWLTM